MSLEKGYHIKPSGSRRPSNLTSVLSLPAINYKPTSCMNPKHTLESLYVTYIITLGTVYIPQSNMDHLGELELRNACYPNQSGLY